MEKEKWKGTFKSTKNLKNSLQRKPSRLPKWQYVLAPLGAGIECTSCQYKIKAMDVVMGRYDLNTCPGCKKEMQPIDQVLLDRMHEEATVRW